MLAEGSRVKLIPHPHWLSQYAPLAERGRVGTVLAMVEVRRAHVQFDMVRRGAKPIEGIFSVDDLAEVNAPKVEQADLSV